MPKNNELSNELAALAGTLPTTDEETNAQEEKGMDFTGNGLMPEMECLVTVTKAEYQNTQKDQATGNVVPGKERIFYVITINEVDREENEEYVDETLPDTLWLHTKGAMKFSMSKLRDMNFKFALDRAMATGELIAGMRLDPQDVKLRQIPEILLGHSFVVKIGVDEESEDAATGRKYAAKNTVASVRAAPRDSEGNVMEWRRGGGGARALLS